MKPHFKINKKFSFGVLRKGRQKFSFAMETKINFDAIFVLLAFLIKSAQQASAETRQKLFVIIENVAHPLMSICEIVVKICKSPHNTRTGEEVKQERPRRVVFYLF